MWETIFDGKNKRTEEKETIEVEDEEDTLPNVETIEELDVEPIAIALMASLPQSPFSLHVALCSMDTKPKETKLKSVQPSYIGMSSQGSTEQQVSTEL